MTGQPISDAELGSVFEAAKWAPSAYNVQPWRFVYAKRNTSRFDDLLRLLVPANSVWCRQASVLVIVFAANYYQYKGRTQVQKLNVFESGMACMSMLLEASGRGLLAHPMSGFDVDKTYRLLNVTRKSHTVLAFVAIGRRADTEHRPYELISQRHRQNVFVFRDRFVNTDPTDADVKQS
ncbi:putative NADH dehydrogenase/NAD(P)H nitroreductase Pnuc_0932 [Oppia nitens]|uniref:putative NADH dehydrogenase/NAD(P)H nitroreductase Pnuc_0932 n=1 Tax=Oppia nitens TaxID=1686743 RepID=UPI0023D9A1D0|nr:putative NADH dehydrogenase/NAD(P)H nitroreductase Pnuc_0932 [Oppia nitens]